jgi:signal transduction histidine kinase/HAMP domain-containing protein/CheY-like chemotaxis protein
VTRVAREVGTEGKLGGQAQVEGVAGTWKDLTDNVNAMATNLTEQVRNIAEVTTAVARGDLSKKIEVDVKGEILELKDTINTMVDQLGSFASEVTRVAREVGTEGKLGGQARVGGVAGTWKDLTDNVNAMATNLTGQVRNIAEVTTAVAKGDLSKKITVDVKGEILELKNTINTMVDQLNSFASEVTRVAREVCTEGKLGGQAQVVGAAGTWKDLTDNVKAMATNLTGQESRIEEVTTAVAKGDLSKKITVDVKGEILELKNTINTMVDQLNSFASEVTRVAREVGTEGKLGGQARVEGVAGTWKDLTDNVNAMATNLTHQVRTIAEVMTAIARGDLTRKLTVDAQGEIAALSDTINGMIATLATFADQVTNVAREVGIEGKLGGQARVPGAAGLWRDLTDNVNQLAANLTTQVRAIAEVATAVTKGDLTRAIAVEASGEVAALKDNINQMIGNLRETTQYNKEQDWLKTNLARFTRMLQGERDLVTVSNLILSELAPLVNACCGIFYVARHGQKGPCFELIASYAYSTRNGKPQVATIAVGDGLVGQCAAGKKRIWLTNVPAEYIAVRSGLGQGTPLNVVILPVLFEGEVRAVIELASFNNLSQIHLSFLDQLMESIGIVLNTIAATMRTEGLLTQSQTLTAELQSQQEELKETNDRLGQQAASLQKCEELLKSQQDELRRKNEELEDKALQLEAEKRQVEAVNQEVERAKVALEEKADQLALTSRYKSEFLANMSHELRTPLNSLLILSKVLAENQLGSLDGKQVEYAQTIHAAGSDLLSLINDILDLAKIESGTVALHTSDVLVADLATHMERTFRQVAAQKSLTFEIAIDKRLPLRLRTDEKRLQQIVMNLLSNAFKFTDAGGVKMTIKAAEGGWRPESVPLTAAEQVVAFEIEDSGIGISPEYKDTIFEAFQQADGTISRRHGGTGLGLSISRELSTLLGGEISLSSTVGQGSKFTLFLPQVLAPSDALPAGLPQVVRLPSPRESTHLAIQAPVMSRPSAGRERRRNAKPLLLFVVSDAAFYEPLLELAAQHGINGLTIPSGNELSHAIRRYSPDAIVLDLQLPNMLGRVLLDQLKRNTETRHIPVLAFSDEDDSRWSLRMGAFAFIAKNTAPTVLPRELTRLLEWQSRERQCILVTGSPAEKRRSLATLFAGGSVDIFEAPISQAKRILAARTIDCVVLPLGSGTNVVPFVEWVRGDIAAAHMPIVAHTSAGQPQGVIDKLHQLFVTTVGVADPENALLDTVAQALHRSASDDVSSGDLEPMSELAGRTVAIVDDDIRNIFALTALLEQHHVNVLYAESGREGLSLLAQHTEIDIVLIDIMMPEMDGYETIREIRASPARRHLPLIAVTAKAMADDRERCLEAGASDYLSKPIDTARLLSVLKVWMGTETSQPDCN